jgi:hypothetical protein
MYGGGMRNVSRVLVRKSEEKRPQEGVDMRLILK